MKSSTTSDLKGTASSKTAGTSDQKNTSPPKKTDRIDGRVKIGDGEGRGKIDGKAKIDGDGNGRSNIDGDHSASAVVRIEAMCRKARDKSPSMMVLEERMPVKVFLTATTIGEAMNYFIACTDLVEEIGEVRSLKVDGHELVRTFIA
jgi:hypothetical protein